MLAGRLAQDGAQVRVIVRDAARWRPVRDQPAIEVVEGDIWDKQAAAGSRRCSIWRRSTGWPGCRIRLAALRPRVILGSGGIYYHLVHVDDLVDGFLLAAEADAAVGEVFIVGGDEVLTLNQLLDRIAATLGCSGPTLHLPARPVQLFGSVCEAICRPFGLAPPLYRRRVDFFTKSRAFCIDKAKRVLGYRPKVALQEGLSGTAASYRTLGWIRAPHS